MPAITNEQLFEKLQNFESLLASKTKFWKDSVVLVSSQEIADYIGYSYDHTKRKIITDPEFPAPVEFDGRTGGKTANRWIAGEVVQFVFRKQKSKAPMINQSI